MLEGVEPDETQGYHVKLTIHADGSQGADTKHKVFWVECGATEPTTTTTTTGESTTTTSQGPTTTTTAGAAVGGIVEEQEPTTTPTVQVEGEEQDRPAELPRTGPGSGGLAGR